MPRSYGSPPDLKSAKSPVSALGTRGPPTGGLTDSTGASRPEIGAEKTKEACMYLQLQERPGSEAEAADVIVESLRIRRGGRLIIDDLTLTIPAGAITGLLGPSGSGKATRIRAIVGVQLVESGEVTVLGEPAGSAALRSRVGYVTQAPSVYGDITVRENLRYFARVLDAEPSRVDAVLATVDLEHVADQLTSSLSGGQRTRVSLATALLNDPDLLVLDEPTVGLDPVLRRDLWETFAGLAATGQTP